MLPTRCRVGPVHVWRREVHSLGGARQVCFGQVWGECGVMMVECMVGAGDVWSPGEAARLRATARRLFRDHGHAGWWDDLTRSSCGACALNGWGEADDGEGLEPNYGGWGRLFVEAGRVVPARYAAAFWVELGQDSPYGACLRRSVRTFGVRVGGVW